MDTSYYKKYEPFFGSWYIKDKIDEGSFGSVYTIERHDMGRVYRAALKIITVPKNKSEIKNLLSEGRSHAETVNYYRDVVESLVNECELMSELKGHSNIVSYEDHICIPHDNDIGYDVIIRMELLTPLLDTMINNHLSECQIVKLGIDMCKALEVCEKKNIIHRDIKPENIFISSFGDYKLGDFGIAKTIEKANGGLSQKGTPTYMAPEVYKGEPYGASVDIYSLGIVLYYLLNGNKAPFLPLKATHTMKENALIERMSGAKIPPINGINPVLLDIVLKACEYRPEDRYRSPEEMRIELQNYEKNHLLQKSPNLQNDVDENIGSEKTVLLVDNNDIKQDFTFVDDSIRERVEERLESLDWSTAKKTTIEDLPQKKTVDEKERKNDKIPKVNNNGKSKTLVLVAGLCIILAVGLIWLLSPGKVTDIKGINDKETIVMGESLSPEYEVVHKKLRAKKLSFSIDDVSVATVDGDGTITAEKQGTAALIITAGSFEKRVRIKVITKVTAINNVSDVSLYMGEEKQLKPALSPEEYANEPITYAVENQKVAKIDANGRISTVGYGSTKIIIEAGGCVKKITVKVKEEPVSISSSPSKPKSTKKSKKSSKKSKNTDIGSWE